MARGTMFQGVVNRRRRPLRKRHHNWGFQQLSDVVRQNTKCVYSLDTLCRVSGEGG